MCSLPYNTISNMGSRITRQIYRNERATPINKQKDQQVKQLIVYFMSFVTIIFFFLYGYLYRPYLHNRNSIGLFFILLLLFVALKSNQINRATIIATVGLLFTIIMSKIIAIDLIFLKATLILTSTALSAIISFQLNINPFFQAFLLWLQYQSFGMGIGLSLKVQKMNMQLNNAQMGHEQSMLVKVLFSLVGLMVVFLISMGKKILKIRNQDVRKQTSFKQQIPQLFISIILLLSAFCIKKQHQQDIFTKLKAICITLILLFIFNHKQSLHKLWTAILLLTTINYIITFATQNDLIIGYWMNIIKLIAVNLTIVDGVMKWIKSVNTGTRKPFIIIYFYFTVYYVIELGNSGDWIIKNWQISLIFDAVVATTYGAISFLSHRTNRIHYEPIIV